MVDTADAAVQATYHQRQGNKCVPELCCPRNRNPNMTNTLCAFPRSVAQKARELFVRTIKSPGMVVSGTILRSNLISKSKTLL